METKLLSHRYFYSPDYTGVSWLHRSFCTWLHKCFYTFGYTDVSTSLVIEIFLEFVVKQRFLNS
jgi:hypothetical protein